MALSQRKITNNNMAPKMSKAVTLADDGDTTNSNSGNAFLGDSYANMILVDTVGDVKVYYNDGTTETLPNLAAGVWHFVAPVKNIESTGTEPTDVHAGVSFSKG